MNKKNNPIYKPRLQPSKETNITGVKRNLLAESEIVETDKEIEEKELAENGLNELKGKVSVASLNKVTGTPLPEGYDPNLPMGKQREFIGLV